MPVMNERYVMICPSLCVGIRTSHRPGDALDAVLYLSLADSHVFPQSPEHDALTVELSALPTAAPRLLHFLKSAVLYPSLADAHEFPQSPKHDALAVELCPLPTAAPGPLYFPKSDALAQFFQNP